MYLTAKEQRELVIKESRNGRGIFTQKLFNPEDILFEVKGVLTTCYEDDDLDEETRSNMYPYDKVYYLSPKGRIGDLLNHACLPNAKIVKKNTKVLVVAIVPITKDQEVFIDYSTILATDDIWTMKCNCGSPHCRGTVKKFKTLPKEIRQKYCSLGMVPEYILD
jgi:hypothetical protein